MAGNNTFRLKIIAPERIFFDEDVDFVEYTTTEGSVGVYGDHIPMTQIIAPGVLRIHQNNEIKEAALLSGFVQILENNLTMLAESVEWPEEIDINRAEEARIRAERRLKGQGGAAYDMSRAEMALKRSLVRLNFKG